MREPPTPEQIKQRLLRLADEEGDARSRELIERLPTAAWVRIKRILYKSQLH